MSSGKDLLYDNGLPFSSGKDKETGKDIIAMNLEDFAERVKNKTASLIVIDGGLGQGKTTLLVHFVNYINSIHGLPRMKMSKDNPQFAMGGLDFEEKVEKCFEQKLPAIGYDEAADFNRKAAMTKFNAMMNRIFQTIRAYNCTVIMALPCFKVLDSDLFTNDIVQGLFHIDNKKQAKYEEDGSLISIGHADIKMYDVHSMLYIKWLMGKLYNPMTAYAYAVPNITGQFKDLPREESIALDKIGMTMKRGIKGNERIKVEGLMGYPEIARKIGRSVGWVRHSANRLHIKPAKMVGQKAFFDKSSFEAIANAVGTALWKKKGRKRRTQDDGHIGTDDAVSATREQPGSTEQDRSTPEVQPVL
jgi:hypothetical protein